MFRIVVIVRTGVQFQHFLECRKLRGCEIFADFIGNFHFQLLPLMVVGKASAQLSALQEVLELDPRPHYHDDAEKVYALSFYGMDIRFRVEGDRLEVIESLP